MRYSDAKPGAYPIVVSWEQARLRGVDLNRNAPLPADKSNSQHSLRGRWKLIDVAGRRLYTRGPEEQNESSWHAALTMRPGDRGCPMGVQCTTCIGVWIRLMHHRPAVQPISPGFRVHPEVSTSLFPLPLLLHGLRPRHNQDPFPSQRRGKGRWRQQVWFWRWLWRETNPKEYQWPTNGEDRGDNVRQRWGYGLNNSDRTLRRKDRRWWNPR